MTSWRSDDDDPELTPAQNAELDRLSGALIDELEAILRPALRAATSPPSRRSEPRRRPHLKLLNGGAQSLAEGRRPPLRITGTDIYQFTYHQCPLQMHLRVEGSVKRAPPTLTQKMLFRRGAELEERYLDELVAAVGATSIFNGLDGFDRWNTGVRAAATAEAIRAQVPFIVHGVLKPTADLVVGWPGLRGIGEPDVLKLVAPGDADNARYEVVDVKSSIAPRAHQRVQVAFYSMLLAQVQGAMPTHGAIIVWPDGATSAATARAHEARFELAPHLKDLRRLLGEELPRHASEPDAFFNLTSKCGSCGYRESCTERVEREKDLSALPGIRRGQKARLQSAGVTSWDDLATMSARRVKELVATEPMLDVLLKRFRPQAQALRTGRPVAGELTVADALQRVAGSHAPSELRRHIDFGPGFRGARVYLDLETDPFSDTVYFFGVQEEITRQEPVLRLVSAADVDGANLLARVDAHAGKWGHLREADRYVAETPDGEEDALSDFLSTIEALRRDFDNVVVFHYGSFERSQLRRLAERYARLRPDIGERIQRLMADMVDVLEVIRATRVLPVSSYGLKHVSPCLKRITGGRFGHEWVHLATLADYRALMLERDMEEFFVALECREIEQAAETDGHKIQEILEPSAMTSVYWYQKYQERDQHPVWMRLIEIYNADDLAATRAVVHWLLDQAWTE